MDSKKALKSKIFQKDKIRKRNNLFLKKRTRSLTAFVLAALVFLSLGRVGWIMVVHGDEYRARAEQNQLYDTELKAVR